MIKDLIKSGLAVTPLRGKIPYIKGWQKKKLTEADVYKFKGYNLGVVCGSLSGGVECIDVDTKYDLTGKLWAELESLIEENFPGIVFYIAKTPSGGRHVVYRAPNVEHNQKLSSRYATEEELQAYNEKATRKKTSVKDLFFVTIETRGEAGQFCSVPSPGYSAESGSLTNLPTLTAEERNKLINICRSFCELEKISAPEQKKGRTSSGGSTEGETPWDAFNKAHNIQSILEDIGWKYAGGSGDNIRMKRPGNAKSKSHGRIKSSKNTFCHWATNETLLPQGENLSPAAVYTYSEHGGNFSAAARALLAQGFGKAPSRRNGSKIYSSTAPSNTRPHAATDAGEHEGEDEAIFNNPYFKVLGFEMNSKGAQVFAFYQKASKTVLRYTASGLSKANLITLAPLGWWEANFPASSSFSVNVALDVLVTLANRAGLYSDDLQRGRGAWRDNERLILHAGDRVYINNEERKLDNNSRFIYTVEKPLNFERITPLLNKESEKVLECFELLGWERGGTGAALAAGWTVISVFGGLLDWRPHIWVAGAAGSGKSWVLRNIIKRLTGGNVLQVQGNTSEAYVRNILTRSSLPVLFDEGEGETERARLGMENILAFSRAASTRDGGGIGKMSADGRAITFNPNSCFCYASIAPQMNEQADRTRITVLNLKKASRANFKKVLELVDTFDALFVNRLLSRTLGLLPVILESIKVIRRVLSVELGAARQADQLAPLLAAAYSLKSQKVITEDIAKKVFKQDLFSEEVEQTETSDGLRCLNHIKQDLIRLELGIERTVAELIDISLSKYIDERVSVKIALDSLQRFGVKIKHEQKKIVFSNTSKLIIRALKNTNYSKNHGSVLLQIEGAEKAAPLRFAELKARGVALPYNIFN